MLSGSSLVYSTYLGGSDIEWGHGIAIDSQGNAYVAGDTVSYDFPVANAYQDHATGYFAAFVTKLTPSGSFVYSTYLGGGGDQALDIAADAEGNAYVTGNAHSTNIPVKNALQPTHSEPNNDIYNVHWDAFVTVLNPAGSDLIYSTYLGGEKDDLGYKIAVDPSHNAYVLGASSSTNFPLKDVMQTAAPPYFYLAAISAAGDSLLYSTPVEQVARDLAVDSEGSVYLAGSTASTLFPATPGAAQETFGGGDGDGDAFVMKLSSDASARTVTFYTPTSTGTYVATGTQLQILIGTNAEFQEPGTARIVNPSSGGAYTISVGGTFGGTGGILVYIIGGQSVSATMTEHLDMAVSGLAAGSCTADDGASVTFKDTIATSVDFGGISANTFYGACQDVAISTNAAYGYSATVQEESPLRTSGGNTIPDTTCNGDDCDESVGASWTDASKNGFGHTCRNESMHDCDAEYSDGTKFRQFADISSAEAAQTFMASTTPAMATGRIKYRLSSSSGQAAGTYQTIITYIVTSTY